MALQLMGDHGSAATEFLRAVKLKPDYTPAYSALVDLHLDLGDVESARNILEAGLELVPDSKILAAQKTRLDHDASETR